MRKKIIRSICVVMVFSLIMTGISIGKMQEQNEEMKTELQRWEPIFYEYFEMSKNDWETGSIMGPDLWHETTLDSWSGNTSFACFSSDFRFYVNDMFFNWALLPITIDVEDEIAMVMDFYFAYITENSDDNWGICLYDPVAEEFIPFTFADLPYNTFGFHPAWTGPIQPMSEYQSFDILAAYDHGYDLGYFRDGNGHQAYELRIGFMFYESDGSGVTNAQAEANDIYWSGLMIDDVSIKHLTFNQAPLTPAQPSGQTDLKTGVSFEFSAVTIDPDDDDIRYAWDWDNDEIIDEVSRYVTSGETISVSHVFESEGTYEIRVMAEDEQGATSGFSEPLTVEVTKNVPPNKPTIVGETDGRVGEEYEYIISATDPDGDDVFFEIEWFDGCPGIAWEGPYESGEQVIRTNTWVERGSFTIVVRVKDSYDLEGEAATLPISMPKFNIHQLWTHILQNLKDALHH